MSTYSSLPNYSTTVPVNTSASTPVVLPPYDVILPHTDPREQANALRDQANVNFPWDISDRNVSDWNQAPLPPVATTVRSLPWFGSTVSASPVSYGQALLARRNSNGLAWVGATGSATTVIPTNYTLRG